jgi:hypothetical protein
MILILFHDMASGFPVQKLVEKFEARLRSHFLCCAVLDHHRDSELYANYANRRECPRRREKRRPEDAVATGLAVVGELRY